MAAGCFREPSGAPRLHSGSSLTGAAAFPAASATYVTPSIMSRICMPAVNGMKKSPGLTAPHSIRRPSTRTHHHVGSTRTSQVVGQLRRQPNVADATTLLHLESLNSPLRLAAGVNRAVPTRVAADGKETLGGIKNVLSRASGLRGPPRLPRNRQLHVSARDGRLFDLELVLMLDEVREKELAGMVVIVLPLVVEPVRHIDR